MAQAVDWLMALGGQQVSLVFFLVVGNLHASLYRSVLYFVFASTFPRSQVSDFDFAPFAETAVLLYGAAFVAERYAGACCPGICRATGTGWALRTGTGVCLLIAHIKLVAQDAVVGVL